MSTASRHGYRGYVTSRKFGGYSIPVPLQSLALRDYCARKGMLYVLPVNENMFPHSYMVLEGLIEDMAAFEGVLMCSMHMLPQRLDRRRHIYKRLLDQNCSLHLVLEDLVITRESDINKIEELIRFSQLASQATIPDMLD